jgi:hypothetical protein
VVVSMSRCQNVGQVPCQAAVARCVASPAPVVQHGHDLSDIAAKGRSNVHASTAAG